MSRMPPWCYPRDVIPSRWTLAYWRRAARRLAKKAGCVSSCDICKRPLHQYGWLKLYHPHSRGNLRYRRLCSTCSELLIHMLDVLEWFGASHELPPDRIRGVPTPEEIPDEKLEHLHAAF